MARRLQIFGVHVHVGVRSQEKAIPIVNALASYVPHFLALSASSPFWRGADTGLASARSKIFEGLPTAGLPVQLAGLGRVRAADGHARRLRDDRDDPGGLVGHPPASRLRHRRAPHLRRAADAAGGGCRRGARAMPGRPAEHPARPRLPAAPAAHLGPAGEQVAGGAARALGRADHRRARRDASAAGGHRRTRARPAPARGAARLRRRTRRRARRFSKPAPATSASARWRPTTGATCAPWSTACWPRCGPAIQERGHDGRSGGRLPRVPRGRADRFSPRPASPPRTRPGRAAHDGQRRRSAGCRRSGAAAAAGERALVRHR